MVTTILERLGHGISVDTTHSALHIDQQAMLCTVSLTVIIMVFGTKEKPQQQR